jgi:hypothetical protein
MEELQAKTIKVSFDGCGRRLTVACKGETSLTELRIFDLMRWIEWDA